MIQQLMYERFGVYYHVFSMAQRLKNRGFSSQQAALSRRIAAKPSGKSGVPPRGRTCFISRKRGMPCSCVAMKRRSCSGGPARIRGRGVVSNPRARRGVPQRLPSSLA